MYSKRSVSTKCASASLRLDRHVALHVFLPSVKAETAQRRHVAFVDIGGVREGIDGAFYAGFAQQMKDRIGRTIREIFDVIMFGAVELISRMKARDLQFAFKPELLQKRVSEMQRVVVLSKIGQRVRDDQQRGIGFFGC